MMMRLASLACNVELQNQVSRLVQYTPIPRLSLLLMTLPVTDRQWIVHRGKIGFVLWRKR